MMNRKLTCILCGKEYETCNCGTQNHSWKVLCDTSNHYQIHLILSDYNGGNIDAKQALNMLDRVDISGHETWNDGAQKLLAEIFDAPTTVEQKQETEKQETEEVEEDAEEEIEKSSDEEDDNING